MAKFLRNLLGLFVLVIGGYVALILYQNNFHEVLPGELYRAGQFGEGDVTYYHEHYGIKSILNLRGENRGAPWYDMETREAKETGVTHIDFRMSTKHPVTQAEASQLIALMRRAPKPLLVHCNGGANRTGFATAVYLAAITKADLPTAESQLSFRYGNFPRWLGSQSRMSESFESLKAWLGYETSNTPTLLPVTGKP